MRQRTVGFCFCGTTRSVRQRTYPGGLSGRTARAGWQRADPAAGYAPNTNTRPVPRLLRQLVLQGARRLPPLQAAIVGQLTGQAPRWMRALAPRH